MRHLLILTAWCQVTLATVLTIRMLAHEQPCFYATANREGEKIGFYFAVQTGGNFDVDYTVSAPDGKELLTGHQENSEDLYFSAQSVGDYKFCFSNVYASFQDKVPDMNVFETSSGNKEARDVRAKEVMKPMESSIENMLGTYERLRRDMMYFRTRENRNFDTVRSTANRIWSFTIIQNGLILLVASVQVVILRTLFSTGGSFGRGSGYGVRI
ncbi:emp24/gp25L/p24 family/GOLD-domain-containing protein [Chytriomyces sp. MP71]|nr:emp24/gp25L/p24 family/GOLD-domain-containing protein [Chytriomyces sp. MP71]